MNQSICALGLLAALTVFGCSDSGDDGGKGGSSSTGGTSSGTGGTGSGTGGSTSGTGSCKLGMNTSAASTSASNACCLLCVKENPCDTSMTIDDCAGPNGYRKCDQYAAAPPACSAAIKTMFDCMRMQADVCGDTDPSCDDETLAAATACGG
jgi:hypothetical protein